MCRLYGFRASEPTKVECTLVHAQNALMVQSRADLRGTSHTDGWGIGVFEDGRPKVEKRSGAAYADLHFSQTAERTYSRAIIAHVRRATVGTNSAANTHPFSHGVWLFAHNGTVTGFDGLAAELEAETDADLQKTRRGSTDSEQAFLWILTRLRLQGIGLDEACPDAEGLIETLAGSVQDLASRSSLATGDHSAKLNFLLTDGEIMVASRWHNSLYMVLRDGVHDCEICGIPHVRHDPGAGAYHAAVLASEPISAEPWQEIPDQHVACIDADLTAWIRPIASFRGR
jgi:predicted glutamine amidotransferase